MAKKVQAADAATPALAKPKTSKPKPTKPNPVKPAAVTAKAAPAKPAASKAMSSLKKAPAKPRKQAAAPNTLSETIISLFETATEILADRLQPSIDQIKALAAEIIGQAEKRARKAQAKAAKATKGKGFRVDAAPDKVAKSKKRK